MSKIFVVTLTLFITLGCGRTTNYDLGNFEPESRYDVVIKYQDNTNILWKEYHDSEFSSDSLYLFFETHFYNTPIEIYLNGESVIQDTLTTEEVLGSSGVFVFGPMKDLKNFGLRVEQGNLLLAELNKSNNIWRINFRKGDLLQAQYSEHAPRYE